MSNETRAVAVPVEEPELIESDAQDLPAGRPCSKKSSLVVFGSLAVALLLGLIWLKRPCSPSAFNLGDKVELDATSQFQALSDKLKGVTSQSAAQQVVSKAMQSGADKLMKRWEATKGQHAAVPERQLPSELPSQQVAPERQLPNSFIPNTNFSNAGTEQGTAQCIFNVMEAMSLTIGLGDDINGMARTCRPPRGADSEIACQVDSGLMVAYIGTIAAKLSLAASNCAESANIDSVCAAGVTGIVGALGELAATASLAAPTCAAHPPALPTTKISELGDQTLHERRLVIGEGAVGNGIQCGVDVSIVAENLANMGLAINQAVHSTNCDSKNWNGNKGLVRALCTVDIGGAIAYFSQAITFIQLSILNCRDYLDISALCGASIAGIATSAAAIAPYGSAIHAACRLNHEAKVATGTTEADKIKAKVVAAGGRRLDEHEELAGMDYYDKLTHVTQKLRATMDSIQQGAHDNTMAEADLQKVVDLAAENLDGTASVRGASVYECQ